MRNMKVKIHDECLEHESDIWIFVEQLGEQRVKNYETGKIEDLDLIIPILNGIADEVENYKEYIERVRKKLKEDKEREDQGAAAQYPLSEEMKKTEWASKFIDKFMRRE